jgi:hypothetical protein
VEYKTEEYMLPSSFYLEATEPICITKVSYYHNGNDIGRLKFTLHNGNRSFETPVWGYSNGELQTKEVEKGRKMTKVFWYNSEEARYPYSLAFLKVEGIEFGSARDGFKHCEQTEELVQSE